MQHFSLHSTAQSASCKALTKAAMCILAESLKDKDALNNVNLMLTEATTNVVRHAYPEGITGDIEVSLDLDTANNAVEFYITDWGCGFEGCSANFAEPTLSAPEEESGRGLYIIAKLADSFSFIERNGRNTLYMRVSIKEHQWAR